MQVVSLQNFEQFDVISVVDKSTEHGKLLLICLLRYHWQLSCPFVLKFLKKIECARKRKRNSANITSFPRSVLLSNKALDQSDPERSLNYHKMSYDLLEKMTGSMDIYSMIYQLHEIKTTTTTTIIIIIKCITFLFQFRSSGSS